MPRLQHGVLDDDIVGKWLACQRALGLGALHHAVRGERLGIEGDQLAHLLLRGIQIAGIFAEQANRLLDERAELVDEHGRGPRFEQPHAFDQRAHEHAPAGRVDDLAAVAVKLPQPRKPLVVGLDRNAEGGRGEQPALARRPPPHAGHDQVDLASGCERGADALVACGHERGLAARVSNLEHLPAFSLSALPSAR